MQHAAVKGQDVKQIEVLTLVFVQPLHLDVEDRIGGDLHAALALDKCGQIRFVVPLHGHELAAEAGIFGELLKATEPVKIANPGGAAKRAGDELRQARIGLKQPPARSDPVGLVVELARIEFVELREKRPLEQLAVQGRHSIDGV